MQQPQQGPVQYGIYCTNCGRLNHPSRQYCEFCNTLLVRPPDTPYYYPPARLERPGCVSAYAVLLLIVAGLSLIVTLFGGIEGADASSVVLMLAGIGLNIALGIGLWQLKEWARILLIVLLSLGLAGSFIMLLIVAVTWSKAAPFDLFGLGDYIAIWIFGVLIGMGVSGYVLYWFASNKKYFH